MEETIDINTAAVLVAVSTRIKDNRVVGNKKLEDELYGKWNDLCCRYSRRKGIYRYGERREFLPHRQRTD